MTKQTLSYQERAQKTFLYDEIRALGANYKFKQKETQLEAT